MERRVGEGVLARGAGERVGAGRDRDDVSTSAGVGGNDGLAEGAVGVAGAVGGVGGLGDDEHGGRFARHERFVAGVAHLEADPEGPRRVVAAHLEADLPPRALHEAGRHARAAAAHAPSARVPHRLVGAQRPHAHRTLGRLDERLAVRAERHGAGRAEVESDGVRVTAGLHHEDRRHLLLVPPDDQVDVGKDLGLGHVRQDGQRRPPLRRGAAQPFLLAGGGRSPPQHEHEQPQAGGPQPPRPTRRSDGTAGGAAVFGALRSDRHDARGVEMAGGGEHTQHRRDSHAPASTGTPGMLQDRKALLSLIQTSTDIRAGDGRSRGPISKIISTPQTCRPISFRRRGVLRGAARRHARTARPLRARVHTPAPLAPRCRALAPRSRRSWRR